MFPGSLQDLGLSEGPLAPLQQVQDPVKLLKDCEVHHIHLSDDRPFPLPSHTTFSCVRCFLIWG